MKYRLVALAHEALAEARLLAEHGHGRGAVSRAYYAGFYAARAVLLAEGEGPTTHRDVATAFSRLNVQTGLLPLETGLLIRRLAAARNEADYDDGAIYPPDALASVLADAETFVEAAVGLIPDPPPAAKPVGEAEPPA